MEATINRRPAARLSVLDRSVDLSRVDWSVVYFAVLLLVVIGTRFFDLGSRALHHDESIHAYYSYQFYNGNPWKYDPAYHGPLLYNLVALGFFLFGVTDATTRVMPAIFGTILIGLTWFLRPYIGRFGQVAAATLLAFSPSIMYYSRALRHDIFALTGTFLLFLALLGFLRTHEGKWLFVAAVGVGLGVTSHELIYINIGIFGLFLIAAFLVLRFAGAPGDVDRRMDVEPVGSALSALPFVRWAILGAFVVFAAIYVVFYSHLLTDPSGLGGLIQGFQYWLGQHGEARGNQPWYYYLLLMTPVYEPLAFFGGIVFLIALGVKGFQGAASLPTDLPPDAYPERAIESTRPAKSGRHNLRGMAALVSGTDGFGLGLPSAAVMCGLTVAFLAFWGFGALVAYSIAGEKMPWLEMQIAFPFALLMGAGIGRLLGRVDWGTAFRQGGLLMSALIVFALFALQSFLGAAGMQSNTTAGATGANQAVLKMVILGMFLVLMIGGIVWTVQQMGRRNAVRVAALTIVGLLFAYEVRSAIVASFRNGDVPREMMVYTQSSPVVPEVAQRIIRLGRDLTAFSDRNTADPTGGYGMDIALDAGEGIQWPFNWYFRDQKKLSYFNPPANGQQVVIAGTPAIVIATTETKNDAGFQQFVQGKYREEHYVLRWWFPEDDYKNPNFPSTFVSDLFNISNWNVASRAGKYLLYRDPGAPLGSTDFYLYTRNDLVSAMGNPVGGQGSGSSTTTNPNPNVSYGLFDMAPLGNANGQFNQPRGIATGPDGSYYVVDTTNMRIQHFDAAGKFLNAWGSEGTGQAQFTGLDINGRIAGTGPGGIAVDKQGNVYVADTWNHRVQKFDSKGTFLTMWGSFLDMNPPQGGQAPAAPGDANVRFYGPRGIAIGSDGTVYVTDTGNKRVLAFDSNGKPLRQIGDGPGQTASAWNGATQLNEPMGIALDAQDNLYIADTFNTRIQVFDKTGKPLNRWAMPSGSWDRNTAFLEPYLAMGADGNLYATDPGKQTVVKMDLTGKVLGSKNDGGKAGTLVRPTGLTLTAKNEVIVVDTEKNGVINMGTIP